MVALDRSALTLLSFARLYAPRSLSRSTDRTPQVCGGGEDDSGVEGFAARLTSSP